MPSTPPDSPRARAERSYAEFTAALTDRDVDTAGAAILALEEALAVRGAGPGSRYPDHARRILRGMVLELADAAFDGLADPRRRSEPLVGALLEQRAAARDRHDFVIADELRDRLAAAGVDVRDSPTGVEWSIRAVRDTRPRPRSKPASRGNE